MSNSPFRVPFGEFHHFTPHPEAFIDSVPPFHIDEGVIDVFGERRGERGDIGQGLRPDTDDIGQRGGFVGKFRRKGLWAEVDSHSRENPSIRRFAEDAGDFSPPRRSGRDEIVGPLQAEYARIPARSTRTVRESSGHAPHGESDAQGQGGRPGRFPAYHHRHEQGRSLLGFPGSTSDTAATGTLPVGQDDGTVLQPGSKQPAGFVHGRIEFRIPKYATCFVVHIRIHVYISPPTVGKEPDACTPEKAGTIIR